MMAVWSFEWSYKNVPYTDGGASHKLNRAPGTCGSVLDETAATFETASKASVQQDPEILCATNDAEGCAWAAR